MKIVLKRSPIQEIRHDILQEREIRLFIKREDLLHKEISGNKIRKLKYNLIRAREEGYPALLTFGGAYSNHIYAVAAAGDIYGFRTIGVIRGEKYPRLNPTLSFAASKGMQLHFISRTAYREKYSAESMKGLREKFGDFYLIPEGGTNHLALKGCTEILSEIEVNYDVILSACGTGGTLAGIISGLNGRKQAIGFPVLKGGAYLDGEIRNLVRDYCNRVYLNWRLETDFHMGGYARYTPELIDFINTFNVNQGIQLDPVYTGKMMYGLMDMVKKRKFTKGTVLLALHSGGLQGIAGFNQRYGPLIQ